ncbi:hypothetical protein PG990_005274 [Apiospora arundinis]
MPASTEANQGSSSGGGGDDRAREDDLAGQHRTGRFLQESVSPIDRLTGFGLTGTTPEHDRDHSALFRQVNNAMNSRASDSSNTSSSFQGAGQSSSARQSR